MLCLSDFVMCRKGFDNQSGGSLSQLRDAGRENLKNTFISN